MMIARLWHGCVPASKKEEYLEYLNRTGIPDYRNTDGNLGVQILCRTEGDKTHFLLISLWESMEMIRAFAGEDVEKARYYPRDQEYLIELEPTVTHYDIM